jgi:hypothetical protein
VAAALHCGGVARRAGGRTELARGRWPRNGRLTGAGTVAQRDGDGEQRGGRGGGPGDTTSDHSGRDGGASGNGGAREAGLSGRAARCPDSGFKLRAMARHVAATWQRRAAVWAWRGARDLTCGAHYQWFPN